MSARRHGRIYEEYLEHEDEWEELEELDELEAQGKRRRPERPVEVRRDRKRDRRRNYDVPLHKREDPLT